MVSTTIDVMRHGEPEGGDVLRGTTDHQLTEKGWGQAQQRAEMVLAAHGFQDSSEPCWDAIVSSPLSRCQAFARKLSQQLSQQQEIELHVVDNWREIDYGDWENRCTKELWNENTEHLQQLWSDPLNFCAPNGEAVPDFSKRIDAIWAETIQQHLGKRILVVCHGGVMRLLLQSQLSMDADAMSRFRIPYAAMSQFVIDHDHNKPHEKYWVSLMNHFGNELNPQSKL